MKQGLRERAGAVIAAGGSSSRMGGIDKIFVAVAGRPLLWHALAAFQACGAVDQVVVVLPEAGIERGQRLVEEGQFSKVTAVCAGGRRRQDSVARGLEKLEGCAWVVVHDGARPCVTAELVERGLEEARETGATIAAVPLKETVKVVNAAGWIEDTPPREGLWVAQTPQVFRFDLLAEGQRRITRDVTDDASMVEALGHRVRVYPGRYDNIKVTTPEDIALAETILRKRDEASAEASAARAPAAAARVGIGYDVHPLVDGRRLVLGGVEVPFEKGLDGHSDADVLVHAIIDALLGAAGLGDIGLHFPSSDESYRGISSISLLREVVALLHSRGWRVASVDASVVAERPRLAPHIPRMRQIIGQALGIDTGRVSVKGTTAKGLGSLGRGEGIAVHAVALLEASGRERPDGPGEHRPEQTAEPEEAP